VIDLNTYPSSRRPIGPSNQPGDYLTVLATDPDRTASKRFVKTAAGTRKIDYHAGRWFTVYEPLPVTDIVSLHEALTAVESFPNLLVIRGAPIKHSYVTARIRRLGDNTGAGNFQTPAQGRRWVLIDFDKIPLPKGLRLKKDPVAVCDYLVGLLPPEFHKVSYHWQLSSSAGVYGSSQVSMHIWFWLTCPVSDLALKTWANHVNGQAGYKLVDPALFQHVQAHYTAAPIFEGMANPFQVRSGLVKKAEPSVDMVLPATATRPVRQPPSARSTLGMAAGFEAKLALIGDHPGGEGFHFPIIAAVASFVATHGEEGTDREALYEAVHQRVIGADARNHDPAYIEDMASRKHIEPAIDSALRKFGSQASTRKRSQLVAGVQPHFKSTPVSIEAAQDALTAFANRAG
jgi:hypothetical protein